GQYISDTYTMRPVKNDPQGLGSCITYMRRYALGAILGLNIDEDDDANKASGLKEKDKSSVPEKIVKQQAPAPKPPSDDYINGVINTLDPDADSSLIVILDEINRATNVAMLSTIFSTYQDLAQNIDFKNCLTHKKNEIKAK
ncbi:MAG: ERF family protein, partial [Muribaculaceae bacterium]